MGSRRHRTPAVQLLVLPQFPRSSDDDTYPPAPVAETHLKMRNRPRESRQTLAGFHLVALLSLVASAAATALAPTLGAARCYSVFSATAATCGASCLVSGGNVGVYPGISLVTFNEVVDPITGSFGKLQEVVGAGMRQGSRWEGEVRSRGGLAGI